MEFRIVYTFAVVASAAAVTVSNDKLMRREQHDRTDDPDMRGLADGCQHVFLDVGSNRGVHVRAIYEPAKFADMSIFWNTAAAKAKEYELYAGITAKNQSASNVCTFGFEANPDFTPRLQALEQAYQQKGWRAKWFNLAVSDSAGNLTFYHEPKGVQLGGELESNADGARLALASMVGTTVNAIDFSQFLQNNIVNRRIPDKSAPATVVMKMDIEGAEFKVLPRLLQQGLMCKGHGIDAMTLEWHEGRDPKTYLWQHDNITGPGAGAAARALHKQVSEQAGGCMPTDILDFDDEIAAFDELPLPNGQTIPGVVNDVARAPGDYR